MKHDYKLIKKCAGMDKLKGQCKVPAILEETVRVQLMENGKQKLDKDGNPILRDQKLWFCKFHFRAMVYQDTKRMVIMELQKEGMIKQMEGKKDDENKGGVVIG